MIPKPTPKMMDYANKNWVKKNIMITKETRNNLLEYYGYLRQSLKVSNDWFEKRKIESKIDALEVLLDIKANPNSPENSYPIAYCFKICSPIYDNHEIWKICDLCGNEVDIKKEVDNNCHCGGKFK